MALRFTDKVFLAKLETAYGTDASPTGGANAVLASEIKIQPMMGADLDRGHETANMGNAPTIPYDLHAVVTMKVELVPSGAAGVAPAWSPLLRACDVAETVIASTSVVYNPSTSPLAASDSLTIYLNIGGILFALVGARGNCDFVIGASGIPMMEFTFTGLWVKPIDQTKPTADTSAYKDPLVASARNTPTFTIDGDDFRLRDFKLAMGNQVETRFMVTTEEVIIVDRGEKLEMQIEATPISTFDPYALARDQGKVAVSLTHGTVAGNVFTLAIPKAQMQRPGDPTAAQGIMEWPLNLLPLPTTGNDQWTLTLT